jgi:hypothetical protein
MRIVRELLAHPGSRFKKTVGPTYLRSPAGFADDQRNIEDISGDVPDPAGSVSPQYDGTS